MLSASVPESMSGSHGDNAQTDPQKYQGRRFRYESCFEINRGLSRTPLKQIEGVVIDDSCREPGTHSGKHEVHRCALRKPRTISNWCLGECHRIRTGPNAPPNSVEINSHRACKTRDHRARRKENLKK